MIRQHLRRLDRLIVLGRRSEVAYLRFYPNPGFMVPWFGGRRLRWSKFYGWKITAPPSPQNPYGLSATERQSQVTAALARNAEHDKTFREGQGV